ncbi:MAG: type II CAAX endopeptidase family protein [Polyangiaceae bacterium]
MHVFRHARLLLPESPRARAVGRLDRHERAWWLAPSMLSTGAVALIGIAVALASGRDPLVTTPWIEGPRIVRILWSLLAGAFVGVGAVVLTKELVRRSTVGKALARELALGFRSRKVSVLVVQAFLTGVSEELLFRGALTPLIGVVLSSILFGLVHQMRGRGRLLWAASSAAVGCAFALVYVASGELVGAIGAHVFINVVNALYLRGSFASLAPHRDVRVQS